MGESEKAVELYLTQQVKLKGGFSRKFVSPNIRGVPDRLCFMPNGQLILVEVKSEGKSVPDYQLREHERLRRVGFTVYVASTKQEVDTILKEYANGL